MLTQLISKENRHKAFHNPKEVKMMKKTKAIIMLALISLSLVTVFSIPIHAVTVTDVNPAQGPVGTEVRVIGEIDTMGGAYSIWFDLDGNGTAVGDTLVKTGNAPAGSYAINTTFVVPSCAGTDAGEEYTISLQDNSTEVSHDGTFTVQTSRTLTVPDYVQEGDLVTIKIAVTGGTSYTVNNFTVAVTDPAATTTMNYNVSFTTDNYGAGYNITEFPIDYSIGSTSNYTGTYTVVANRTLPGEITNASTATFVVGLTDAQYYNRFENVNLKTSGWAVNQNITVTIKNPSMENVKVWENVNATDGTWTGDWTIPVDAPQGTYTVEAVNDTGLDKTVASLQTFTVQSASLKVMVTEQPATSYMRTQTVTAKINITYPDNSFYTAIDLGEIQVGVYQDVNNVANVTLTAEDFNATTNEWIISWISSWNATLADDYQFVVKANEIVDANNPNKGPLTDVSTGSFELQAASLNIDSINTTMTSYVQGEVVTAYFTAMYQDGTPVITGSAPINMTMANGTSTILTATYIPANSRFEAQYSLNTESPLGTWTALLEAQNLEDNEGNTGPTEDKTTTFTVTKETAPEEEVAVNVKITPQSLNMKSKGKWVMVHIKVTGASPSDVDLSTILLDGVIEAQESKVCGEGQVLLKFNRAEIQNHIKNNYENSNKFSNVELTISGEVDGQTFEDTNSIKVKK
ncbi:MAG: hypothetical protein NUK63_04660 [Candidatus Bathyarchaeum tardum]|nr:MAG: hypothetical protein NUK63_04660 [Candidatus Bathyarchaeum tardum]